MAVSQSGRSMSPFTTCRSTGGLSWGTPRPRPPHPCSRCRPHLVHHPVSGHDHQCIPAAQLLRLHQLPSVVLPLCRGSRVALGPGGLLAVDAPCTPSGRDSPVSTSMKETSAWASRGCTWLRKSCRALPLPPRGLSSTSTRQGRGSTLWGLLAANTNPKKPCTHPTTMSLRVTTGALEWKCGA